MAASKTTPTLPQRLSRPLRSLSIWPESIWPAKAVGATPLHDPVHANERTRTPKGSIVRCAPFVRLSERSAGKFGGDRSPPFAFASLRVRRLLLLEVFARCVRGVFGDDPARVFRVGRTCERLAKESTKRLRIDADFQRQRLRSVGLRVRHSFVPFMSGEADAFALSLQHSTHRSFVAFVRSRLTNVLHSFVLSVSTYRSFVCKIYVKRTTPLPPPPMCPFAFGKIFV